MFGKTSLFCEAVLGLLCVDTADLFLSYTNVCLLL